MTRLTATEIETEANAPSVVVDHKRRVYWIPEETEGDYPSVGEYEYEPRGSGEL